MQESDGIETGGNCCGIAQRPGQATGQLARPRTRQGPIDGAQQAALFGARKRAQQLDARSGGGVYDQSIVGGSAARRAQGHLLAKLRQLDVLQECARGRQFRAREGTECGQLRDAKLLLQKPVPSQTIEGGTSHWRHGCCGVVQVFAQLRVHQRLVADDHFAGRQAHDVTGKVGRRGLPRFHTRLWICPTRRAPRELCAPVPAGAKKSR